jgi:glycerophosphoryl diester phosphodiesterase
MVGEAARWLRRLLGLLAGIAWIGLALLGGEGRRPAEAGPGVVLLPVLRRQALPRPPPILLISEVMNDPPGVEPAGEWIEVYNPGSQAVGLEAYRIGDAEFRGDGEGMFRFPPGSSLASGGVIVLANQGVAFFNQYGRLPDFELNNTHAAVPEMVRQPDYAPGGLELSNPGDEVFILDDLDGVVDGVSWGNSAMGLSPAPPAPPQGASLERKPSYWDSDRATDWWSQPVPNPYQLDLAYPTPTPGPPSPTATRTPTPLGGPTQTRTPTGTPPPADHLLLSEALPNPGPNFPGGEWIEIHNPTGVSAALDGYKLGDEETSGGSEGMYAFPAGTILAPNGLLLVARSGLNFKTIYGFWPDFEVFDTTPEVADLIAYSAWGGGSFNLADDGDELLLLDAQDNLVDAVSWGISFFAFSPPLPVAAEMVSFERFPVCVDTDGPGDWRVQSSPGPGEAVFCGG